MSNSARSTAEANPAAAANPLNRPATAPSSAARRAQDFRSMGPGDLHPNELYA